MLGKTSTRDMVYSVVKQKYKTLKTEGNYNNENRSTINNFKISRWRSHGLRNGDESF